jgi:hypothetical protein
LKKVNLGGIAKKKEDSSSKYQVYPDEEGKGSRFWFHEGMSEPEAGKDVN